MDKIQKQGSRIAELIDKGREQGYLTYADVNDHLPEDISDPDQVDEIIGMINDLGLQVHETAPDADTLMLSESSDDDDDIAFLNNVVLTSMRFHLHSSKIIKRYIKKKIRDKEKILLISAINQILFLDFKEYAVIN